MFFKLTPNWLAWKTMNSFQVDIHFLQYTIWNVSNTLIQTKDMTTLIFNFFDVYS